MNIFNLRSKRDTDLEPDVEHETWLKQVYVMGNIEKRAKHAAVALDDNQVFIFGGQTDKKEIDNSCFIIQERIIDEPNAPREPIISKIKVTLKKSDLKRKQTLVQMEKDTVRYYITIPPISNPHESPPSLRSHTAVRYKDKIVIFGGKNKAFLNSTYILNTTTWEWQHVVCYYSLVPDFPVDAVRGPTPNSLSPSNSKPSSPNNNSTPRNSKRLLRIPQGTPIVPISNRIGRCNHSAVMLGDKMIVYGGTTDTINKHTLGDLWSFDMNTHRWTEIEPKGGIIPPSRHSHVALAISDTCMLVWGGKTTSGGAVSTSTTPASPSEDPFDKSEPDSISSPQTSRNTKSIALDERTCWLFNTRTCMWSPMECKLQEPTDFDDSFNPESIEFKPRHSHAGVYLQNGFALFFGGYRGRNYFKDFVLLDLQRRVQIPLALNRKILPASRKYHSMNLIDPSRVILFGGTSRKRGRMDDVFIVDVEQLAAKYSLNDNSKSRSLQEWHQMERDWKELSCNSPSKQQVLEDSEISAKDGTWYLNKGTLLFTLRRYQEALTEFDKAVDLLSEQFETEKLRVIELRATTNYILTNFEDCIRDLKLVGDTKDEELIHMMAYSLVALGRVPDAISYVTDVLNKHSFDYVKSLLAKLQLYEKAEEEQRVKGYNNIHYAKGVDENFYEPQSINAITQTTTVATSNITSSKSVTSATTTVATDEDEHITLIRTVNYEHHFENDGQLTFNNKNAWNVVLVLGADRHNGCTTFLQQLRLAYQESMSPQEGSYYKTIIQKQCIAYFFALVKFRLLINEYYPTERVKWIDPETSAIICENLIYAYNSAEITEEANTRFLEQIDGHLNGMFDILNDRNIKALRSAESFMRYECLIEDSLVYEILSKDKHLYELITQDNLAYFLDNIRTIFSPDYEPTTADILRLCDRTTIHHPDAEKDTKEKNSLPLMYKKYPYHLINVIPNKHSKLPSMDSMVQDLSIMILVVSLGDIDKLQPRDPMIAGLRTDIIGDNLKVNSDSGASILGGLKTFDEVCNSTEFENVSVMVVFTKFDVFQLKLRRNISLKKVFPDYDNTAETTEAMTNQAQKFIQNCFNQVNGKNKRKLHFHYINTLDRFECCKTLKAVDELTNAVETKKALINYGLL